VEVTILSSTMSPSGTVSIREMYPAPGPLVTDWTMFAATKRSEPLVVVSDPLPVAATETSTGLPGARPRYSRMRMSAYCAEPLKVTVTLFSPAFAGAMPFAE